MSRFDNQPLCYRLLIYLLGLLAASNISKILVNALVTAVLFSFPSANESNLMNFAVYDGNIGNNWMIKIVRTA